jgi:exopolyphosphatase/guanosine-5'-triphosphate,3'-diphosphate pyrophosphatase
MLRGQRRKLLRDFFRDLPAGREDEGLRLCVLLRLAVLLYRSRQPEPLPALHVEASESSLALLFPAGWLRRHPLTRADLQREREFLAAVGIRLRSGEAPRAQ